MRDLNWRYMLNMSVEGCGEIWRMQEYLRAKVDGKMLPLYKTIAFRNNGFTEIAFEVHVHHAYHHLNFVWGCRHATLERAMKCVGRDCRFWEKFPLAFKELLPSAPRRAVATCSKAVLHPESILLGLEEALRVGEEIYLGLCAHFTEATCPRRWDRRAAEIGPLTEARLKELLCRLLGALNFAWNVRRLPIERVRALSPRARQRRRQYPAELATFLTARHFRNRA